MTIKSLSIECLRNISNTHIKLGPNFNFFYGQNGAGKTSVLEAVDLVSSGRTFRTRYTKPLIKDGHESLKVKIVLSNSSCLKIEKTNKATRTCKDDKPNSGQSVLSQALPVWSIHPDSHNLIQGPRSSRRKFIDKGLFHVKHDFYPVWKAYQKALKQRNHLLNCPEQSSQALKEKTEAWEGFTVKSAEQINQFRKDYIRSLEVYIRKIVSERSDMPIRLIYRRGWKEDLLFSDILKRDREKDRERGYTQAGPHRAELELLWEEKSAKEYASRGQQKTTAIVFCWPMIFLPSWTSVIWIG